MPKKDKKKGGGGGGIGLSFEDDLDGEGPEFKVQKKKKAKLAPPPPAATSSLDTGVYTGAGVYSADYLQKLKGEQIYKARKDGDDEPIPGDVLPDTGSATGNVPDAVAIAEARARRERARRQAEDGGEGDDDGTGQPRKRTRPNASADDADDDALGADATATSRLVREEQADEDSSVFDGQDGQQLRFGMPHEAPPAHRSILDDDADADDADAAHPNPARRDPFAPPAAPPASFSTATAAAATASEAAIAAHAARVGGSSGGGGGGGVSEGSQLTTRTLNALAAEVSRAQQAVSSTRAELDETQRQLEESGTACGALDESIASGLGDFDFLQRAQAYAEDLLDCLREKAPAIEAAEAALSAAYEEAARARRDAFEPLEGAERARAQVVLKGAWRAPPVPRRPRAANEQPAEPTALEPGGDMFAALQALDAAEAARAARRPEAAGAAGGDVLDAWGDDDDDENDEDDGDDSGVGGTSGGVGGAPSVTAMRRVVYLEARAAELMADTLPEFGEVRHVRRRFRQWQDRHPASYNEMYLKLCVPTLLSTLVRMRQLTWRPLAAGSVEEQGWYTDLVRLVDGSGEGGESGGGESGGGEDGAQEEELGLLAQLTCKVALPRVQHAIMHAWDVHAPNHTHELVQSLREIRNAVEVLSRRAEAARGEEDEAEEAEVAEAAEAALRGVQMHVAARLDGAVNDTCIPPCVAPPPATPATPAQPGSVAHAACAASAASERRLVRAVRLMGIVGEWGELLAVGALQQLCANILTKHIIPYLTATLAAATAGAADRVVAACERAALSVPAAWRRAQAADPCTAALRAFVGGEVRAAAAAAGGGAKRLEKLEALL